MKRNVYVVRLFLHPRSAGAGSPCSRKGPRWKRRSSAATFEVDPMWPKPLPTLAPRDGHRVSVDAQDHIWIIHRGGSLERMETTPHRSARFGVLLGGPPSWSSMSRAISSHTGAVPRRR